MKRLAVTVVGAGAVALSACTNGAAPHAAGAAGGTATGQHTSAPIVPVSCRQQYRSWSRGEGKGLMDTLGAVSSGVASRNTHVLIATLTRTRPAVEKAARHPIPACADPRGFWSVLLMHLNGAVGEKASASSVRAALHDVGNIHRELLAEIKQNV